jgi:hypothetical protein
MAIIKKYDLTPLLIENIQQLTNVLSINNLSDFYITINYVTNNLKNISQHIRNSENRYGKNISGNILIYIITFLQTKEYFKCLKICRLWNKELTTSISSKIYFGNNIFGVRFKKILNLEKKFGTFDLSKQNITASVYSDGPIYIYDKHYKLLETKNFNGNSNHKYWYVISSNNYFLVHNYKNIKVFSDVHESKELYSWCFNIDEILGIIEYNKFIFISTSNKICKYTIDGKFICEGKLPLFGRFYDHLQKKIAVSGEYIFIANTYHYNIDVFTSDCKYITTWDKKTGHSFGNMISISVFNNNLFLSDYDKICVFNFQGKRIFKICPMSYERISNIIFITNNMYVCYENKKCIYLFELIK